MRPNKPRDRWRNAGHYERLSHGGAALLAVFGGGLFVVALVASLALLGSN